MSLRLTNSEAKSWRRCKRSWYLGHYRELADRRVEFDKPMTLGTRVHDALASYYIPGEMRGDPLEVLRASVSADMEEYPEQSAEIKKEADMADAMLTGYMEWVAEEGVDQAIKVVEAEGALEAKLFDGVTVLSKIDARVEDLSRGGVRLALEHKTVQSLKEPLATLQLDTQLLTEHLVEHLHELSEGRSESARGALYNMLRKCKRTASSTPPYYAREPVDHNLEELRSHWSHVTAVAEEILEARAKLDDGGDHHKVCHPNPTRDCKWDCEFFRVCGMHDDGTDPEPAIQDLYVTKDPLERYAELARINLADLSGRC